MQAEYNGKKRRKQDRYPRDRKKDIWVVTSRRTCGDDRVPGDGRPEAFGDAGQDAVSGQREKTDGAEDDAWRSGIQPPSVRGRGRNRADEICVSVGRGAGDRYTGTDKPNDVGVGGDDGL